MITPPSLTHGAAAEIQGASFRDLQEPRMRAFRRVTPFAFSGSRPRKQSQYGVHRSALSSACVVLLSWASSGLALGTDTKDRDCPDGVTISPVIFEGDLRYQEIGNLVFHRHQPPPFATE